MGTALAPGWAVLSSCQTQTPHRTPASGKVARRPRCSGTKQVTGPHETENIPPLCSSEGLLPLHPPASSCCCSPAPWVKERDPQSDDCPPFPAPFKREPRSQALPRPPPTAGSDAPSPHGSCGRARPPVRGDKWDCPAGGQAGSCRHPQKHTVL